MGDYILNLAVTQAWQVTVLFFVVAALSAVVGSRRPHLVLLLWVLFLVKCLVPPLVQSPVSPMSALTPTQFSNSTQALGATDTISIVESETGLAQPHKLASEPLAMSSLSGMSGSNILLVVWATGSLLVLLVFVVNYTIVRRRVFGDSVELDENHALNRILSSLGEQVDLTTGVTKLVVSRSSIGPLVFGFLRPTIVLPAELVASKVSMRPIVAHELCHVWRRDHLLGLIQMAAQVVFWFHPFVWFASSCINRLCEVCCDDDTIRLFDLNSKSYASGLLDVLSLKRVIRPIAMAPGIRPVEITKQRIASIVSNRHPKTRQSQMIVMCVFLCLALPGSVPRTSQIDQELPKESSVATQTKVERPDFAEIAQRRIELDFLLGSWEVRGANGENMGVSKFAYEKSGKMIREDWVAADGQTAQGITFFDPGENCWKMTWVDSTGMIMESAGQWTNDSLTLDGLATLKDGRKLAAQTVIEKLKDGTLRTRMNVVRGKKLVNVSQSRYVRKAISTLRPNFTTATASSTIATEQRFENH